MKAHDTVVLELKDKQITVAKNQQDTYNAYEALQGILPYKPLLSRWVFTPEERQAIAEGADLFFTQCTFGEPIQPFRFVIARDLPEDEAREQLNIREYEIRFIHTEDATECETVEQAVEKRKEQSNSYFPTVMINGLMFTWEQLLDAPELAEAKRYIERANGSTLMREPPQPRQPEAAAPDTLEVNTDGSETVN